MLENNLTSSTYSGIESIKITIKNKIMSLNLHHDKNKQVY